MSASSPQQGLTMAKEVQEKAENDGGSRQLSGFTDWLLSAVAVVFGIFQIYTAGFGAMATVQQRSLHVGFSLITVFMLSSSGRKASQKSVPWYDWLLIALSIITMGTAFFSYELIIESPLTWPVFYLAMGAIAVLLVLEGTRRALDLVFPVMVALSLLYALFGNWVPGLFHHNGIPLSSIIEMSYLSTTGLWGTVVGLSATLIAIYIIFGSLLLNTGAGEAFFNISMWIAGRARGGPAKVAVIASMFFGMISGSATANVATVGTFTIPMMKRTGYRPEFAAATEGVASTGGQIMPPIMGAAAFVMAQFLGVNYSYIAAVALLPAVVYYFGAYVSVHLEAVQHGLGALDVVLPPFREMMAWKKTAALFVPIGTLFVLFGLGFSPGYAGFYAIILMVVIAFLIQVVIDKQPVRLFLGQVLRGFRSAAPSVANVALLVAASEVVVGLIAITGVSVKIGDFLSSLAGTSTLLALILAAFVVTLFGTGLPTTASYMLGAAIVAPSLIHLGFDPLPTHFFIFYYAVLAVLTPPVAPSVMIAAGIAGTGWVKANWIALAMAIPAYLVPFVWMYDPALLLQGSVLHIAIAAVNVLAGTFGFAVAASGFFFARISLWQRIVVAAAGLLLYFPPGIASVVGFASLVTVALFSRRVALSNATAV